MPHQQRLPIVALFAYIQIDDDGGEALTTTDIRGGADLLVTANEPSIRRLRTFAQEAADLHGRPVQLVTFEARRQLGVVYPSTGERRPRTRRRA